MNRNLLFGLLILIIFLYQCQSSESLSSAVNRRWINQGGLQDSLHGVPYDVQSDPSQVNQVKLQELRNSMTPTLAGLSDIAATTRVGKKLGTDSVDERSKHMVLRQQGIQAPTKFDISERGAHERINTTGRQTTESFLYSDNVLETGFPTAIKGHMSALSDRSYSTRV